jgi:hypothetical protein
MAHLCHNIVEKVKRLVDWFSARVGSSGKVVRKMPGIPLEIPDSSI